MTLAARSIFQRLKSPARSGWIGVDIGSHYVKLAQVELFNGAPRLAETIALPIPSPAAINEQSLQSGWLSDLLKEVLTDRKRFRGRRAACVLSMAATDFRYVNLPFASTEETREMLVQELNDSGVGSANSLEFDFWSSTKNTSEPDSSNTVNVLSISRGMATQVAHQLLDAGLSCQVLDGGPFALARAIQLANASSSKTAVGVMDWGGDILNFTIMVNGEPAFTRVIHDCGMRKFVDAIRAGLDLPAEECHEILATHGIPHPQDNILNVSEVQEIVSELLAEPLNRLVSEMEKTISFLTNQRPELSPREIWLVGGGAAILNGDARLTSAMHLPVRRWKMPRVERSPLIHDEVPVELFAQAAALSQLGFES